MTIYDDYTDECDYADYEPAVEDADIWRASALAALGLDEGDWT